MQENLEDALCRIFGKGITIKKKTAVSGGDINEAYHLLLTNGEEVFLKRNAAAAPDFFPAERSGLEALKAAGANTPEVLAYGKTGSNAHYLLLGYVRRGSQRRDYWTALGHQLAKLHRAPTAGFTPGGTYGFVGDNYIGQTRQANAPANNWVEFFRRRRLAPQMHMASPCLEAEDRRRCRALLDHLEQYLTEPGFPSLLHGDLWSGNVMPDCNGSAMLIDPAVYVGHHETDLAMTELFGGFSPAFYEAYHEILPSEPGYADRREIYHLYHLLNHLNLFGRSYLSSVRRILRRYAP